MSDWQPIATAPRDGTRIDLWMVNERGEGWRVTDAYFVPNVKDTRRAFDPVAGNYFNGVPYTVVEDQWWAERMGYEGHDGPCGRTRFFHEMDKREVFIEPTHWMPIPAPPEHKGPPPAQETAP